jgi:tetratricopeptide (TPR) repeat protein
MVNGEDGVSVWRLIDGVRDFGRIQDSLGISHDYLKEIINNWLKMKIVGVNKYAIEEPDTSESEKPDIDSTEVANSLERLYRFEMDNNPNWKRIAAIIEEANMWETDSSKLQSNYFDLAIACYMINESAKAESLFNMIILSANDSNSIRFENRGFCRIHQGKLKTAKEDFVRALSLLNIENPKGCLDACLPRKITCNMALAWINIQQGKISKAREIFAEVVKDDPQWKNGPVEYPNYIYTEKDKKMISKMFKRLNKK